MRRHEISSRLFYHWKEQYAKGRFNNEPSKGAALEDRVRQLEQLVGRLILEIEAYSCVAEKQLEVLDRTIESLSEVAPKEVAAKEDA